MGRHNILMTFACVTCGHVHTAPHAGYAVIDINKPVCADIGQEEDRACYHRVHPIELEIKVQGSREHFKLLVKEIMTAFPHIDRDPGHPLYSFVQEIEDQLEPNADREFDFIDLYDLFREDAHG